jgi:deoxyribose-phosphate aldolase
MVDVSAVKPDSTADEVRHMVAVAKEFACIAVFAMPALTPLAHDLLSGSPHIALGGVVGFPSGAVTTATKVAEAQELIGIGCDELDMVINIGRLKSGQTQAVAEDIEAVIGAAAGRPVKVILECHYLTDDEIRIACELCVAAGAAFVKTGTGWAPTGATPERIQLMKSVVGDRCGVKAAGGVRDLETVLALQALGATRFGIGVTNVRPILGSTESNTI